MGQGRKKRERSVSSSNRRRRCSISVESSDRNSQDLLTLFGIGQDDRLSNAHNNNSSRKHYDSSLFKSTRHDSLVDYISPQQSSSLPVKPASNMQCSFVGEIPLVSTSSGTQSGLAQGRFGSQVELQISISQRTRFCLRSPFFLQTASFLEEKRRSCRTTTFPAFVPCCRICCPRTTSPWT